MGQYQELWMIDLRIHNNACDTIMHCLCGRFWGMEEIFGNCGKDSYRNGGYRFHCLSLNVLVGSEVNYPISLCLLLK